MEAANSRKNFRLCSGDRQYPFGLVSFVALFMGMAGLLRIDSQCECLTEISTYAFGFGILPIIHNILPRDIGSYSVQGREFRLPSGRQISVMLEGYDISGLRYGPF